MRFIARVPLLLMVATLALCAQVALVETERPSRLLAALPLAVVTALYVRAGRTSRRRRRDTE